ncbi:DMT family transporter [Sulfitobacter sp. D35]|uniref:DMT family transporter n=1 Tax=Sulfitobacter sp. D35 TaxID=3083252 RepID=UPI00296FBC53|nr:DMT family transporter [Sulfitobacter sp. D35]MDW4500590.1 DMT family transporter [Sulfitobacter sp. D35]
MLPRTQFNTRRAAQTSHGTGLSPNTAGALLMMASMACFTINDAMVKATAGEVPLFQLLFIRGVIASVLIYAMARLRGSLRAAVPPGDRRLIALRSLSEVAAAYFFLSALMQMPLANVSAVLQALPLTVTLASALFFNEPVGWKRWTAILVGFCGMLLILRPGPEGFSIWSIYALLAVLSVTVRDLCARRLSPGVPSMTVTLAASITVTVCAGLASATTPWSPVGSVNAALIAGSALFVVGGYFCSVQVMRSGDVAFIAPFRYTSLLWALLLGWVIFGDWPAPLTMLGAAIIVATGLFTLYRERKVAAD